MKTIPQIGLGLLFSSLIIGLTVALYGYIFHMFALYFTFSRFMFMGMEKLPVSLILLILLVSLIPIALYALFTWIIALSYKRQWPIAIKTMIWVNIIALCLGVLYALKQIYLF